MISIDDQKAFNQIQDFFLMKTLSKLRIEIYFYNVTEHIGWNETESIIHDKQSL